MSEVVKYLSTYYAYVCTGRVNFEVRIRYLPSPYNLSNLFTEF